METIRIHFEGPFSWREDVETPCIFSVPQGRQRGLYLWTLRVQGENLPYYVGETGRRFSTRHWEHLKEHMAGFYHLLDLSALSHGRKRIVWHGMYGVKTRESTQGLFSRWRELAAIVEEQSKIIQFYLAATTACVDVRREVERELAMRFVASGRNFQDGGVQYRGGRKPIGKMRVELSASQPIVALPEELVLGSDAGVGGPSERVPFTTPY